eukprot:SAG31_NODE_3105_length_4668_cov_1.437733_2_plen_70_part_00
MTRMKSSQNYLLNKFPGRKDHSRRKDCFKVDSTHASGHTIVHDRNEKWQLISFERSYTRQRLDLDLNVW